VIRPETFDVVIVGGGVMGSSVAYHLKLLAPQLSVLVLERDPSFRLASSALSASSIRQQFSTPVNIALSRHSFAFLKDAGERLAVDGQAPEIGLVERGYLYLASAAQEPALRQAHALQRAHGADIELLSPAGLEERFPWLNTAGVALGSLGQAGEGWFDGYGLLQAFRRKARALGAAFRTAEACGFGLERGRIVSVRCTDGSRVECGEVVNAAGPHAAAVCRWAGVDLPVQPRRHCVFVLESPTALPGCPLVIDPSGVYFRPEGARYIAGAPPRDEDAGRDGTLEVDHALFDEVLWPALAHRVPAFEALRQVAAWAGFYEMNTLDQNAIIGRVPQVPNLLLVNGFSGHGIQQSPAAGLALAEIVVHGAARTVDVEPLGFERIAAGRPLRELNVI
jgi:glycine/D-amino acid oxidase-like deaminating enzyme